MMDRNSIAEKILCVYFNLEVQKKKKWLPSFSKALCPIAGGAGGIHGDGKKLHIEFY